MNDLDAILNRDATRDVWIDLLSLVDEVRMLRERERWLTAERVAAYEVVQTTRGHECSTRWYEPCGHQRRALAAYDQLQKEIRHPRVSRWSLGPGISLD